MADDLEAKFDACVEDMFNRYDIDEVCAVITAYHTHRHFFCL